MKLLQLIALVVCSLSLSAQINMADKSAQAITYFSKKETQKYSVIQNKYKVNGTDTTDRESTSYDVEVLVKDSGGKHYTMVWKYNNFKSTSQSPLIKKLVAMGENMQVVYKTDEMGSFTEVVNWQEIKTLMDKNMAAIKKEFATTPMIDEIVAAASKTYGTKEAIEANGIKDIEQFHTFFGLKYTLNEVISGELKLPNNFGGDPFDCNYEFELTDLDEENDSYIVRYAQSVNKDQATESMYQYLKKISPANTPERKKFPAVTIDESTASSIHSSTGWILYSINSKEVKVADLLTVEERIIELQ